MNAEKTKRLSKLAEVESWVAVCAGCSRPLATATLPTSGSGPRRWRWKPRNGVRLDPLAGNYSEGSGIDSNGVLEVGWKDGVMWARASGDADFIKRVVIPGLQSGTLSVTQGVRKHGNVRLVCKCGRSRDVDPVRAFLMHVPASEKEVTL